jgi:hypothetical protein
MNEFKKQTLASWAVTRRNYGGNNMTRLSVIAYLSISFDAF